MKLSACVLLTLLICFASTKHVVGADLRGSIISSDAAVDGESEDYEQVLRRLKSGDKIPESYIILFEDSTTDVKGKAKGLLKKYDLVPDFVYENSIQGFAVKKLNEKQAAELAATPGVVLVEQDQVCTIDQTTPSSQTIPWGITRVKGPAAYTGSNVAWVIDTGIELSHPDLKVNSSKCFFAVEKNCNDLNGHGTHVAGIIAAKNNTSGVIGVASGATVIPVKVLSRSGSGTTSGVIAGVDFVGRNAKPGDVANMSLGGGISPTLDTAVIAAASKGIYFTLAAGNSNVDASNSSPARANGTNIFTISAMDNQDRLASFSNYGNSVDYAAPGVGVNSTYKGGSYATLSGTSMAAPHAAGVLLMTNGQPKDNGTLKVDRDATNDRIISCA